jgi:hypothetical protein
VDLPLEKPLLQGGIEMTPLRNEEGVTLFELMLGVGVIMVVVGSSIFTISTVLPKLRADSGLEQMEIQLRQARISSIDQRRDFTVTFQGTNELVVVRQEVPAGTTIISDTFLPPGMVYMVFSGLPDTPDGFGNAYALNFACPGNTVPCSIVFQSDGSVLAVNNAMMNGTVFMGVAGNATTARAVTVMGATGRIHGYHSTGTSWF